MPGWKIDRDYLNKPGDGFNIPSRVGVAGTGDMGCDGEEVGDDLLTAEVVRFRLKDDDGEVYYGGWLHDDEVLANQWDALQFGMRDAGCTDIEIKRGDEWKADIG